MTFVIKFMHVVLKIGQTNLYVFVNFFVCHFHFFIPIIFRPIIVGNRLIYSQFYRAKTYFS